MGHLVNATSMRIGWSYTWKDLLYIKFFSHSDYIHHLLRIRYFLIHMFFAKDPWDVLLITYSHFVIQRLRREFNIMIFVYLGKLMLMHDYMEFLYRGFTRFLGRFSKKGNFMTRKERKIVFWIRLLFIFIEGGWLKSNPLWAYRELRVKRRYLFHQTGVHFWSRPDTKIFVHKAIISYLGAKKTSKNYGIESKYLRQKYFYTRFLNSFLDNGIFKWQEFWDILFTAYVYTPFFSWYKDYIEYLIYFIILSKDIVVSFIYFTNDDVTPAFLTRYMARKLDQLFTWRQILAPIRNELNKVIPVKFEISSYSNSSFDYSTGNYNVYNGVVNIINIIFNLYDICIINNKYKYYIWFNLDIFNSNAALMIKYYLKYINFISLSAFINNFIADYNNGYEYSLRWRVNNYNNDYYNYMLNKIFCVYPLYNIEFYSNSNNALLREAYNYARINASKHSYKCINFYVSKEFSFALNEFNMRLLNPLRKNIKFQGYKIYLKGRLSRRQRASFFWLSYGKMPLNTFSSSVDHGAYTLPVKNSALTINIWFCAPFDDSSDYTEIDPDSIKYISYKKYNAIYKKDLLETRAFKLNLKKQKINETISSKN